MVIIVQSTRSRAVCWNYVVDILIPQLDAGQGYSALENSDCLCNTVFYSTISACAFCQGHPFNRWVSSTWIVYHSVDLCGTLMCTVGAPGEQTALKYMKECEFLFLGCISRYSKLTMDYQLSVTDPPKYIYTRLGLPGCRCKCLSAIEWVCSFRLGE